MSQGWVLFCLGLMNSPLGLVRQRYAKEDGSSRFCEAQARSWSEASLTGTLSGSQTLAAHLLVVLCALPIGILSTCS